MGCVARMLAKLAVAITWVVLREPVCRAVDQPSMKIATTKIVLVADVGVDDAGALLWALASDKLEILGVVASFGCHWDVRVTASNALRVLRTAGRSDVPVFMGSRLALGRSTVNPSDATLFHGADGFGGLSSEELAEFDASDKSDNNTCAFESAKTISGAEFLLQEARAFPGEVVVLCFSSLTDVALASMMEPSLPYLLKSLIVMGGAVFHAGNVSPLAEANFARDAAAAEVVLRVFGGEEETETIATGSCRTRDGLSSRAPLVLAPLDVTHRALIGPRAIDQLMAGAGRSSRLFARAAEVYRKAYCDVSGICEGFPLHDAHTVAFLLDSSLFTNRTEMKLQIINTVDGQPEHGMSVTDRRIKRKSGSISGGRALVLLDVDQERFVQSFLEHMAKLP